MPHSTQLAFVFPGQGSQSLGMLSDLATRFESVRRCFDEASQGCGLDLWALSQHGPDTELNRTEVTQPALLTASVAVYRLWTIDVAGPQPTLFAGHSLGEYTALVCAGALSLAEGAALVRTRGRLMQEAVPQGVGAMAAILAADDEVIAKACVEAAQGQIVSPANFNSPGQTVIAGNAEAIERTIALLAERGVRKAIRLPVSVPSHCALMRPAADALKAQMLELNWKIPSVPVIHNADAAAHTSIDAILDALVRQLHLPVRWTECVQILQQRGATRFGECGPGKVLTGLVKRIDKSLDARALGSSAELDTALNDWRSA
jgi:[acyl-carrier-protein] S-malonyltransferase